MKNAWIELQPQRFSALRDESSLEGAKLTVMISPYDIPEAVRVTRRGHKTIIEFSYVSEEVLKRRQKPIPGVVLSVGRTSGRVYSILIDQGRLNRGPVESTINRALKRLALEEPTAERQYGAARIAASLALTELAPATA